MPAYTLNVSFTVDDLKLLNTAGSNVIVAKPNGNSVPNVAWIAFRALEHNSMTWEESYGIYASNTELTAAGADLYQVSQTKYPAVPGKLYDLAPYGAFEGPGANAATGSYSAVNLYKNDQKYLTFGLYQNAQVNGTQSTGNAVSAAVVPYNNKAVITPYTTVYIWLASQVVSNSVITSVTSVQTIVQFGAEVTKISLQYDSGSGQFIPASEIALGEGVALDYVEPVL